MLSDAILLLIEEQCCFNRCQWREAELKYTDLCGCNDAGDDESCDNDADDTHESSDVDNVDDDHDDDDDKEEEEEDEGDD